MHNERPPSPSKRIKREGEQEERGHQKERGYDRLNISTRDHRDQEMHRRRFNTSTRRREDDRWVKRNNPRLEERNRERLSRSPREERKRSSERRPASPNKRRRTGDDEWKLYSDTRQRNGRKLPDVTEGEDGSRKERKPPRLPRNTLDDVTPTNRLEMKRLSPSDPVTSVVVDKELEKYANEKITKITPESILGRTGGVYIPPFKLAQMQQQIADKGSVEYQRQTWEALRKSINGLVNKVNIGNIANLVQV